MENEFFSKPILNSPYEYPSRHWELDNKGQPTHQIIGQRRRAEFITPIPKPKKRKGSGEQLQLFDFEEDDPISSADQRYDPTPIINELRKNVDDWRKLPNLNDMVVDENDELIDTLAEAKGDYAEERDFVQMILENLKTAGVQQAHKVDKINFTSLTPWPGDLICAEGGFRQDEQDLQDENKGTQSPSSFPVEILSKKELPSSSARNSAQFPDPTWSLPPARLATPVSTCSSPAPSTTTLIHPNSTNLAAFRCSKHV